MSDHKHGSMSTDVQEKTFSGFVKATTWMAGLSIGVLIFLALFNT